MLIDVEPPSEERVSRLRSLVAGSILTPNDEGYDLARQVWNGHVDRYPSLIARCRDVADVVEAVNFARQDGLLTAVRGGGHSFAGFSVCDNGMLIDLSSMKGIEVDAERRTVRVEPGVTWGELDAATQSVGLAVTGGLISHTGVAGLTLGGGIGWLMRKYGLTCDHLISAELVTAEGRRLTSSRQHNAELFWGLRGGGGNFGIVTSFEFQLHEVGQLVGGLIFYAAEESVELLKAYRTLAADLPDEISTVLIYHCAPPLPFVPERHWGRPGWGLALCAVGSPGQAEPFVAAMRDLGHPLFEVVRPMPYTQLQSMFDASATWGTPTYLKSNYLSGLSDPIIDVLASHCAAMPPGLSQVHVHQMGGAVDRMHRDETAFSGRSAMFCDNVIAMWEKHEANVELHTAWVREFWRALQTHATAEAYINFMAEPEPQRLPAAYGRQAHKRLVALKRRYDPNNLFRLNQNIDPSVFPL